MKSLPFIIFFGLAFSCLNPIFADDSTSTESAFIYERMEEEEKLVSGWSIKEFLKQFGLPYNETYVLDEVSGRTHRVIYPASIFKNDAKKPVPGVITVIFGHDGKTWRIYNGDLTTVYIKEN